LVKEKRILVACGTSIATSTVIADRIRNLCEKHNIPVKIIQCKVPEVRSLAEGMDLIVASTRIPSGINVPYVNGVSYLSGIGMENTDQEILRILKEE